MFHFICSSIHQIITKLALMWLAFSFFLSSFPCWNRYKKLLCTVDLTKDFFFSYSYNVMHSLQRNLCKNETGLVHYETMFVWNEFLTRGIRNNLKNTLWTVALVYGFFKQVWYTLGVFRFIIFVISENGSKDLLEDG